jgi:hypothetical protein
LPIRFTHTSTSASVFGAPSEAWNRAGQAKGWRYAGAFGWQLPSAATLPSPQSPASAQQLQAYLNEFTFRFNRRFYPFNAFRSLLGIAGDVKAPTYAELSLFRRLDAPNM